MRLLAEQYSGKKVVLGGGHPNQMHGVATQLGFQIVQPTSEPFDFVTACAQPDVVFGTDGEGSFVFPEFQPVPDGLFAVAKLAMLLQVSKVPLSGTDTGLRE